MTILIAFLLGLVFSFIGSIPPGTLNVIVLQLGIEKKISIALRFTAAVTIMEYPYAWIAVRFESWITSTPAVIANFSLITAIVMTVMGVFALVSASPSAKSSAGAVRRFQQSGFRRGILLSILNPMIIPFWIGITAFLKAQGWLDISTPLLLHSFLAGTSVGVLLLLVLFTFLAKQLAPIAQRSKVVKYLPGITLLTLGAYAFIKYLSM